MFKYNLILDLDILLFAQQEINKTKQLESLIKT